MKEPTARILVVDDYESWRRVVTSSLQKYPDFLIVGEASDGLTAVEKARELQPKLILLDIGLPRLNGIQAARQIRQVSPTSKILFVTENSSPYIAEAALRTGAIGYLVKSDAARELLPAIKAVLKGKQFVSASLSGHKFTDLSPEHSNDTAQNEIVTPPPQRVGTIRCHEVDLYSDDRRFLEHVTQFIGAALKAGNAGVVVATEPHRESLLSRLQAHGLDIDAAIEQGRYIAADAASTVSKFIVNGIPDSVRLLEAFGNLILTAIKATRAEHPRVAVFGEGAQLLCQQGNVEAAIQMEKLGNQLTRLYDVDILCGYSLASLPGGMESPAFQQICAEHSAAYSY